MKPSICATWLTNWTVEVPYDIELQSLTTVSLEGDMDFHLCGEFLLGKRPKHLIK